MADRMNSEGILISCRMNYIWKIAVLLCVTALQLHAQENSDSTACVPVRTVNPDSLAFGPGEKASFTLHYEWGAINSDVGHATVSLDTVSFNGQKAFRCSLYGKTTRLYDFFFKVREEFKAWFTYDGLRPLKFYRHSQEGDYEAKNTSYSVLHCLFCLSQSSTDNTDQKALLQAKPNGTMYPKDNLLLFW